MNNQPSKLELDTSHFLGYHDEIRQLKADLVTSRAETVAAKLRCEWLEKSVDDAAIRILALHEERENLRKLYRSCRQRLFDEWGESEVEHDQVWFNERTEAKIKSAGGEGENHD